MTDISRRDLFKFGGVAALGVAGASAFAGCAPQSASKESASSQAGGSAASNTTPSFFVKPDPITDFAATHDYDVVVVGAGAAGVCAALKAFQDGAKVALLQKEATAISQGNTCTSILTGNCAPGGVEALISELVEVCDWRADRNQIAVWAYNSEEALKWLWDIAQKAGAQVVDSTAKWTGPIKNVDGFAMDYFSFDFGPKPYNTGSGMKDICAWAEGEGLEIFYETPAVQLAQDESGAVTGVVAQPKGGDYELFNAAKGVIVATGDYENDEEMMAYYEPAMSNIWKKESGKTGDGQKMMVWAGGVMETNCGAKVQHDFDAGPGSMADMPFLCLKNDGTRFCNEARSEMAAMGNFLKSEADSGWYTQIFDSNYMTDCADWPGALIPPEGMVNYMPEVEGEKTGVYDSLINTYSADTIEELAEKLGIEDVPTFVKSVERYNELVEKGVDEDMGKEAKWLKPIVQPPFYGIHRHIGLSTIIHGVNVNTDLQVLDENNEPISGLYAVGNCAGGSFGAPDYPMTVPGQSLGRAHTLGYVAGKLVASL